MQEGLLDRVVENMNVTLAFNTGKHERIFTIKKDFASYVLSGKKSETIYQILLMHLDTILIKERFYQDGKQEESQDIWNKLEEKVFYTLANQAVLGDGNLVEITKRLQRR